VRTAHIGIPYCLQGVSKNKTHFILSIKTHRGLYLKNCHLHMPIVLKSGSLRLLELSGSIQACTGIALIFTRNVRFLFRNQTVSDYALPSNNANFLSLSNRHDRILLFFWILVLFSGYVITLFFRAVAERIKTFLYAAHYTFHSPYVRDLTYKPNSPFAVNKNITGWMMLSFLCLRVWNRQIGD